MIHSSFDALNALDSPYKYATTGAALSFLLVVIWRVAQSWRTNFIPTVGNMWKGSILAIRKNREMVIEGYRKYPDGIFRIPMFPFGTMVVLNGTKLTDEIRTGSNEFFSFDGFFDKMAAASYTVDPEIIHNPYHIPIIQTTLTRNIAGLFGGLVEEMEGSFDEILRLPKDGWNSICVFEVMSNIISRMSNRVVVGSPLCSNKTYYHAAHKYAVAVMTQAHLINLFPTWTHPLTAHLFAKPDVYVKLLEKYVGPMIDERWKNLQKYGAEWPDKPNDYLMWIMEAVPAGIQPTHRHLIKEILFFNFAAIHTSGMALTHALYELGAHPEHIEPLRDEAKEVISEHGWTKVGMQKMRKADSFLRESARLNPTALINLIREVKKDYTFSNGTTIPKGSWVSASSYSVHMDEHVYKNPYEFSPWRFYDDSDKETAKNQYVVTSNNYLAFGAGKHACPGRFFAANELKALLAYIVLNYDIRYEREGTKRPENIYIGSAIVPDETVNMLIRKRPGWKPMKPSTWR